MIIVRLTGGLGNQLFQYAAARALSIGSGKTLVLEHGRLHASSGTMTPRTFELQHFCLSRPDAAPVIGRNPQGACQARCISAAVGLATRLPGVAWREKSLDYQPLPSTIGPLVVLEGYFQSYRYFQHIRKELLEELTLVEPVPSCNAQLMALVKSAPSVSLHVRRGDYVSNPAAAQFHGLCSMDYYRAAIESLESCHGALEYFIFSDDPAWCRENFAFLPKKHFVECNSPQAGYLDLNLMRHCKYHIIANSSFSWWGAWLADYSSSTVIYPRKWFADTPVDGESRSPPEWQGV